MGDIAIRAEGLGKQYHIGGRQERYRTLRDTLTDAFVAPFRRASRLLHGEADGAAELHETIWALRDVSLEVEHGEVVGIIGRNGAGKSTLLKILSRITEPTEGYADVYGRVGSLLEVGTGFHGELTGRENIYLNGAILGMRRAEIDRKFDEIVEFAEVGPFIDTPVKHYSSGMQVRLAFAVAAHLEPEILLVDEVLAVGDAQFRKKCMGKMSEVAGEGRTVLFVSHNMAAISHLCHRAVFLDKGRVVGIGKTDEIIRIYLESIASASGASDASIDLSTHPRRDPGKVPLLQRVRLMDAEGREKNIFRSGETMLVELVVRPEGMLDSPQLGIGVNDGLGQRLFSLVTYVQEEPLPRMTGDCTVICQIDELPLPVGRYTLSLSAGTYGNLFMDHVADAVAFDVEAGDFFGTGKILPPRLGLTLVRSRWRVVNHRVAR